MNFERQGIQEALVPLPQEKTARWTRHLLLAGRLAFVFSHGILIIASSAALAWVADPSWWLVFIPVWLGDVMCLVFIVASWFASCPYVYLCLSERRARHGDDNPSIITDILPDTILSFLSLIFMVLVVIAEVLLCRHLSKVQRGESSTVQSCAAIFMVVSLIATCRGICIRNDSAMFVFFGGGVLATCVARLCTAGGLFAANGWILVLPWCISAVGLLLASVWKLQVYTLVLNREERLLHIAEQVVLLEVLIALLAMFFKLVLGDGQPLPAPGHCGTLALAGAAVGVGTCALALVWGRMALIESRTRTLGERLITWQSANPRNREEAMGAV